MRRFQITTALVWVAMAIAATVRAAQAPVTEWSELARLAVHSLFLDATRCGSRWIAVGERGHVLVSDDGESWTQIVVPTRSLLTTVASTDEHNVWAAGHDAVIIHSTDGGQTWTRQSFAPEEECPLLSLWFENSRHGFAFGAYGFVLETEDGGNTWVRREVDPEESHWNGSAGRGDTIVVAAEFGAVYRSEDRGATWNRIDTPYDGSFFGALCLRDGTFLVFGLRGTIYRSPDDGRTWEPVESHTTASLNDGVETADGTVILVGLSGCVLTSHDGGQSFAAVDLPQRVGLAAVVLGPDGSPLAFGEEGVHTLRETEVGP